MANEQRQYGPQGQALTETSEGLYLTAYPDPIHGWAVPTIGYGHTKGVKQGDTCTKEQAVAWLLEDIQEAESVLRQWVTVELNEGQWDACGDFVFNMGAGRVASGDDPGKDGFVWLRTGNHSTLLRLINQSRFDEAAEQFPHWDASGPPGLIIRHKRQRELFLTGTWSRT